MEKKGNNKGNQDFSVVSKWRNQLFAAIVVSILTLLIFINSMFKYFIFHNNTNCYLPDVLSVTICLSHFSY